MKKIIPFVLIGIMVGLVLTYYFVRPVKGVDGVTLKEFNIAGNKV